MASGRRLLEAGRIISAHGVNGAIKILPWTDSPVFLTNLEHLFIDGKPVKILSSRVHKNCVIAVLDGVDDIDGALRLKDKTVFIDRDCVKLEEGRHFIADLVGLRALDAETGGELGVVVEVMSLPANNVYVIKGSREILVPAMPDFIEETDIDGGFISVRLIDGM